LLLLGLVAVVAVVEVVVVPPVAARDEDEDKDDGTMTTTTTPSTLSLVALDPTQTVSTSDTPRITPRTLNQADLQRRLRMLLQDQEQLVQGREIANVTMTNSIVTSYKQGGRPTVQSDSSWFST